MRSGLKSCIGFFLLLWTGIVLPGACTCKGGGDMISEMREFDSFFSTHVDSVATAPRRMRTQVLQRMKAAKDSLVRYNYLSVALKTCLATSDIDSAQLLIREIEDFTGRQPFSHRLADLQSECLNMKGNIYSRKGYIDSAEICFKKAYEWRLQGTKPETVPDILINLADANNHLGRLDMGVFWYRKALLICDSLNMPSDRKFPIYYGLAQGYMTLRDYEQCDYYSELAAKNYDEMLPDEKHFYLNNRGNSYYYRGDYATAIGYFRKVVELVKDYPDMRWGLNLSYLNLSDCFLQRNEADSAAKYLDLCEPFFKEIGSTTALYYIDTQKIELALQRNINYGVDSAVETVRAFPEFGDRLDVGEALEVLCNRRCINSALDMMPADEMASDEDRMLETARAEVTESLRPSETSSGDMEKAAKLMPAVDEEYARTIAAIKEL